ncbi:MAG: ATP synthase epsilon chain [Desulfovibrio sp.]
MALHLEIVTPDRVVLKTEAEYVSLPGVEGEFGILPGHIPFFAALKVGCMHYIENGKTVHASICGGFAEVSEDTVQVLADAAELSEEIDVSRAEAALRRAEERLAAQQRDKINVARAEASLHRAVTRLHAAEFK